MWYKLNDMTEESLEHKVIQQRDLIISLRAENTEWQEQIADLVIELVEVKNNGTEQDEEVPEVSTNMGLDLDNTKSGDKVKFCRLNVGHDHEKKEIELRLEMNKVYTVKELRVNNWSSYVTLETGDDYDHNEDYPFNTLFFENVE
jgi:hypothetical protein